MSKYVVYGSGRPFATVTAPNAGKAVAFASGVNDGHQPENCVAEKLMVRPSRWASTIKSVDTEG